LLVNSHRRQGPTEVSQARHERFKTLHPVLAAMELIDEQSEKTIPRLGQVTKGSHSRSGDLSLSKVALNRICELYLK